MDNPENDLKKIDEFTLKGKDVFRLLVPAHLKNYDEKFFNREQACFTSNPVESSMVTGMFGSDCSWTLEATRSGELDKRATCFHLLFSSKNPTELEVECRLNLEHPLNRWTARRGDISSIQIDSCSKRILLGSLTDEDVEYRNWMKDGNVYVHAEVFFRIQRVDEPPSEKIGDRFLSCLKSELADPTYSDFVLTGYDGQQVKTHKMILGSISPVFRAMFATDCQETQDGNCTIEDMDGETIRTALDCAFGYTDVEDVDCVMKQNVFRFADKYQIEPLRTDCVKDLRQWIHTDTVIDILMLADKHSVPLLKNEAFLFLEDHLEEVTLAEVPFQLMQLGEATEPSLYEQWLDHMYLRKHGQPRASNRKRAESPEDSNTDATNKRPRIE